MNFRYLTVALIVVATLVSGCQNPEPDEDSNSWKTTETPPIDDPDPLLLIGIDGLKASYLETYDSELENLNRLADQGVRADSLRPVFPSHSFPNLYSIVTGLYPENHGIVANTVYDPERDETLSLGDQQSHADPRWWEGEPIWVTAEKQDLEAGTFFWVGSEAPSDGIEPTRQIAYDSSIRHRDRTDAVVDWLTEDEPVDFATLYFASPDGAGHQHGTSSAEVADALKGIDNQLERLIQKLSEAGLWPDINVVIVSDHGMTDLSDDHVVFLDDIIDLNDVWVRTWSPVAMIEPYSGNADKVYDQLSEADDHYTVYRRDELPERYRLKNSDRVPEIVVVADKPYTLTSRDYYQDQGLLSGGHGFDPAYEEMHGIFIAYGPDIPDGARTETLEIVDIYPLMTHLLGLEPADHDGSLDRIGSEVFGD